MSSEAIEPSVGRNEPCPCGSRKKYKRCCGVAAAPKLSTPSAPALGAGMGGMPPGQNPFENMSADQMQAMTQMTQALQRLPKGQMQRLQALMQKAMSGKDVTREAQDFEKTLPLDLQTLMKSFQMPGMGGMMPGMPGAPGGDIETQAMPVPGGDLLGALPSFGGGAGAGDLGGGGMSAAMSAEEARKIVEEAAAEGKISADQAQELLAGAGSDADKGSKLSKFFKFGKK